MISVAKEINALMRDFQINRSEALEMLKLDALRDIANHLDLIESYLQDLSDCVDETPAIGKRLHIHGAISAQTY